MTDLWAEEHEQRRYPGDGVSYLLSLLFGCPAMGAAMVVWSPEDTRELPAYANGITLVCALPFVLLALWVLPHQLFKLGKRAGWPAGLALAAGLTANAALCGAIYWAARLMASSPST